MSEWRTVRLGDVCELKRGYDLPKSRRVEGAVPIYSSSGPSGFHSEAKVHGPGVVTGRYGTLGQVYFVQCDYWPLNTALYVRDFKGNEPRFIAALLESMELDQYDGAAAVPGLNRNQLHELPVAVPDMSTQRVVSQIATAIDDLIENNRRRVGVLEEMARAVYREWFVHFRYPGHEDVPLVDSPLGPIPEGWECATVVDIAELVKATVAPGELAPETQAVGLEHIPRRQITLDAWGSANGLGSRKTVFARDDILFGKIRPYFHKVSVAPFDGICSTDALVLRQRGSSWGQAVMTLSSDEFVAYAHQTSNGTKMPRADWKVLKDFPIVKPIPSIAERFTEMTRGLLGEARVQMLESKALASLRDLLLPRLVTGRIDVSDLDLDALVEATA